MLRAGNRDAVRVVLVGPTAVGKTAVSIALARMCDAEIVSADSMQVYRWMDIGTAKPDAEERRQATFHLIDLVDPDAEWTLADYQAAAERACADCRELGKLPLIVGGTGLYVRALTTRLDIPSAPPNEALRSALQQQAAEIGCERLHDRLRQIDPEAADRIHVNDLKRIIRAIEVHDALGVTLSELHARNRAAQTEVPSIIIGLDYADRRKLYDRIERRVDQMMALGFVDEVRGLLDRGYHANLKPMQSLGYRQMCAYLAGNVSLADAVEEMKRETRHYARRQLIWFRADKRVRWLQVDSLSVDEIARDVVEILGTDCSESGGIDEHEQATTEPAGHIPEPGA